MYSTNVYELLTGINLAYDRFKPVKMQCYKKKILNFFIYYDSILVIWHHCA